MFSPGHFRVMVCRYCKLVTLVESLFFVVPPLFFCPSSPPPPPPSLFQLDFKSWHGFNPQFFSITLFLFFPSFPLLHFFPSFFLSSSNVFLPFSPAFLPFFLFPILFPFLFFLFLLVSLFSSPFCCFSFPLSSNYYSVTILVIGSRMYK